MELDGVVWISTGVRRGELLAVGMVVDRKFAQFLPDVNLNA